MSNYWLELHRTPIDLRKRGREWDLYLVAIDPVKNDCTLVGSMSLDMAIIIQAASNGSICWRDNPFKEESNPHEKRIEELEAEIRRLKGQKAPIRNGDGIEKYDPSLPEYYDPNPYNYDSQKYTYNFDIQRYESW